MDKGHMSLDDIKDIIEKLEKIKISSPEDYNFIKRFINTLVVREECKEKTEQNSDTDTK